MTQEDWDMSSKHFAMMLEICSEKGINPNVVIWPEKHKDHRSCSQRGYAFRELHRYGLSVEQMEQLTPLSDRQIRHLIINTKDEASVYAIEGGGFVKIGISTNIHRRMASLQASFPFPLTLLAERCFENARKEELRLHSLFKEFRAGGEWFKLPDHKKEWLIVELTVPAKRKIAASVAVENTNGKSPILAGKLAVTE